jgi:hypothetical protein
MSGTCIPCRKKHGGYTIIEQCACVIQQGEVAMKFFLFLALCVIALVAAGTSLVQDKNLFSNSDVMSEIHTMWVPFLFAFIIVGFGTIVLRRLNK